MRFLGMGGVVSLRTLLSLAFRREGGVFKRCLDDAGSVAFSASSFPLLSPFFFLPFPLPCQANKNKTLEKMTRKRLVIYLCFDT
jgi:hypothetical protein